MSDLEDLLDNDLASSAEPVPGLGDKVASNQISVSFTGEEENTEVSLEVGNVTTDGAPAFDPRAYQLEMFDESMKQNIIVAAGCPRLCCVTGTNSYQMDTGSGKTHVAIMRIQAELDRCPPSKMVWFMAPTVSLCLQQFEVIQKHIPAVHMKCLSGNDNVDKWTEASLWNAILRGVRVVVCTYQILLDALTHGFVYLESLTLIVFDEAHNCVKGNAGAKVMRDFYEPAQARRLSVPSILGLSASPVMNSRVHAKIIIEETLHAVCKTPSKSRADLLQHVKMPEFCQILYKEGSPQGLEATYTPSLTSVIKVYQEMDIYADPYIISLRNDVAEKAQRELGEALQKRKTWCFDQMKAFCQTSRVIFQELGPWAVDYYIERIISRSMQIVDASNSVNIGQSSHPEKTYLSSILRKIELVLPSPTPDGPLLVSDKVRQFIDAIPRNGELRGIVFVQQRATVAVLAHLISVHPETRSSLRVGTMVGTSNNSKKSASIADCVDVENQKHTLAHFRTGELDLVIATSVLEEGIDVPACNLVICFNEPANLKSFVQRRGRARQRDSKLVLMFPSQSDKLRNLQELEMEMKRIYEDNMRVVREVAAIEDANDSYGRAFRIEKTNALLNLDNAVSHLYHFCSVLPGDPYVDRRPEFIAIPGQPVRVILPKSVEITLREFLGQEAEWTSEKRAKKDAAFEACLGLYKAGLINDNLMPLLRYQEAGVDELVQGIEKRPSFVLTSDQMNPWIEVAKIWAGSMSKETLKTTLLTITDEGGAPISTLAMTLPIETPELPPIRLYWDADTEMLVTSRPLTETTSAQNVLEKENEATWLLLNSAFGYRFPIRRDAHFIAFFRSILGDDSSFSEAHQSVTSPSQLLSKGFSAGLIRYETKPYIFEEWLDRKPCESMVKHPHPEFSEAPEETPHLVATSLPRRSDFLHSIPSNNARSSTKRYSYALPQPKCTVDDAPLQHVKAALLIPSIMHRLTVHIVADKLSKTILADVGIQDLRLVVTAISASVAREETNYERLEFLGDSLLKICTSVQLLADYPHWHQGYLSAKKDRLVSNVRLAKAASSSGLPKFILTKPFTGRKWKPMYVEDFVGAPEEKRREMSSKVLADVVEALIGAAMVDGGIQKALACIKVFLPEVNWQSLATTQALIFRRAPGPELQPNLPNMEALERLVGYSFTKKSLLVESMTHASCSTGTASLERLEFLGDAVLDHLIIRIIYDSEPELAHHKMHLLKTALVNADFLAFICMEWSTEQETYNAVQELTSQTFQAVKSVTRNPLWKFMRHTSTTLSNVQLETAERYQALRLDIKAALAHGSHYPWALLSRLQAEKFFSDMVESLLGAVYIDSGSFETCQEVLERMGVLQYLRRIINDDVHVLHPKEELGILADTKKVKYKVGRCKSIINSVESIEFTCEVFVGDELIIKMGNGVSGDEIQKKAAEAAVKVLKLGKIA